MNVAFYNYMETGWAAMRMAKIDGHCLDYCSGYTYHFSGISFSNTQKKFQVPWIDVAMLKDEDASLNPGHTPGSLLVPTTDDLDTSVCSPATNFPTENLPMSSCSPATKAHRFSFNSIEPDSLEGHAANFTNQHGFKLSPHAKKRITHPFGWATTLMNGDKYLLSFENGEHITNITYRGVHYDYRVSTGEFTMIIGLDFYFSVHAQTRRKRGGSPMPVYAGVDIPVDLRVFKCYFENCVPPVDPDKHPPVCTRPGSAILWSSSQSWSSSASGKFEAVSSNGGAGLPALDSDVTVTSSVWLVLDVTNIPRFHSIFIDKYGTLEVDNSDPTKNFVINVVYMVILGRFKAGCGTTEPFLPSLSIELRGTHATPTYRNKMNWDLGGPTVGAKAIGTNSPGYTYVSISVLSFILTQPNEVNEIFNFFTGWARISNVEFYRMGQEGFDSAFDPRHALTFLDVGQNQNFTPCYVKNSTFHQGYSTAIAVYSLKGLTIQDSVIHGTVGSAIITESEDTTIDNVFITHMQIGATYRGRKETYNFNAPGGIEALKAKNFVMRNVAVAGAEKAAYRGPMEPCDNPNPWYNNHFHSSLNGAVLFNRDTITVPSCWRFANFTVWRCFDFGLHYQKPLSLTLTKSKFIENGMSAFVTIVGPDGISHQIGSETYTVKDNLFVGQTPAWDCSKDDLDMSDYKIRASGMARGLKLGSKGRLGATPAMHMIGDNAAPSMPWKDIMNYPSIFGVTYFEGTKNVLFLV
ncbi:hypothetical protein KUTeg_006380 [Tegillarca granosa]|uniref:G8 domain-containing protein n=1 Tax=Tegillarca granosa TaxID=220873 RepID=A0ABQ9FI90_TEGGR|nr:hypothetical protein KUTeg_006380 [Tegillarca granosa]